MTQVEIRDLLTEASGSDCSHERRGEILGMFTREGYKRHQPNDFELLVAMRHIYLATSKYRPEKLIGMFPFLVYTCAKDVHLASDMVIDVDWLLIP